MRVAAGVFAPRHLGELTRPVPFETVGAGAADEQRSPILSYLLAAAPQGEQVDGMIAPTSPWWPKFLTPLLPIAASVVALGVAERSRDPVAAGLWIGLMVMWLCQWSPLGALPDGTLSLRPGHYLIAMALPLAVFAAVRYARTRTARD